MANSSFGYDKAGDSPGFLLWQTTMSWQRLLKAALEPYNVSHAQFVILAILLWFEENNYDTTQGLIVSWSKLDKMTVSKSLKKLSGLGLVLRSEHESDSRAKSVSLTVDGRTLIQKLIPIVEGIDEEYFSVLSEQQRQSLLKSLGVLAGGPHE